MPKVVTASIIELKADPMGTLSIGKGGPVAIIDRDEIAFYCVPAEFYAGMVEQIEDAHLSAIADERMTSPELVPVKLSDL